MCEVFKELPEEKQMRVMNAAMEVFSQNDYKRASTDDIAAKAGISKGSLFYYFKNKKSLYMYLYNYVASMVMEQITDGGYLHEKRRRGEPLVVHEIMEEFKSWADMLKKIIYKEEYLHG